MTTFIRVHLMSRDERPGDVVLLNVAHIERIYPAWPKGCTIVTGDATLHVKHSFEELTKNLASTGGNVMVKVMTDGSNHGVTV